MDEQYKESGEPKLERPPMRFYQIRPIYMIAAATTAVVCFWAINAAEFYRSMNASINRQTQTIDGASDRQTQRIDDDASDSLAQKIDGDGNRSNDHPISLKDRVTEMRSDLRNIKDQIDQIDQIVYTGRKDDPELMKNHGSLAIRMGDTYYDLRFTERKFREMARKDGRDLSEDEKAIIQNLKARHDQASVDLEKDLNAYLNSPHREKAE